MGPGFYNQAKKKIHIQSPLLSCLLTCLDWNLLPGLISERGRWSKNPGGTSLWVRRGCAPVLGSFWPENSGIGVSFYWKISVIGVYFHSEFSGSGGYSKFCNGCVE